MAQIQERVCYIEDNKTEPEGGILNENRSLDGYTENPGDLSWDELAKLGDVTVYDRTYVEDPIIAERIGDAEVVITNKTPISKQTIDKCPNMKLIAFLAAGYNVADYNYAKEKGVLVCYVPTYGTACVGQYAIALLLEVCHHIGHHDNKTRELQKCNKLLIGLLQRKSGGTD